MKILNFSLDRKILDPNSAVAERMKEYGELVDRYTIIVPASEDTHLNLSSKTDVYGVDIRYGKGIAYIKAFRRAAKRLEQEKYDLITVQAPYYLGLLGLILARKFGLKLEVQVHGFENSFGIKKMMFKRVLRGADSVRVVSERVKKEIVSSRRFDENKIKVLPIFTDVSEFKVGGRVYVNDKDIAIITAGRLAPVKNIFMQINAMAEITKRYPKVKLNIVGDGILREKLEFAVKKKGLNNNIKFLGWQKDLKEFYEKADIFVLTSNKEGWGLVVVEAATAGLPIIMTDVGCAGEFITSGENGVIIPVGDEKRLSEEIINLIEKPDIRKRLGENARASVEKLRTKEEYLLQLKNNWEQCL